MRVGAENVIYVRNIQWLKCARAIKSVTTTVQRNYVMMRSYAI